MARTRQYLHIRVDMLILSDLEQGFGTGICNTSSGPYAYDENLLRLEGIPFVRF